MRKEVKIGGLVKLSLIDYPGKLSAVIFLEGCNFRCSFCHNPDLVLSRTTKIDTTDVFVFLKKRIGMLNGVVITGGEPTVQHGLVDFIREIKMLGFSVKLDTNGSNPRVIKKLLDEKLIDYIAMDIKAPFEQYDVGAALDINKIKESIKMIKESNLDYEFRTTIEPRLNKEDLVKIAKQLGGAKRFALQEFQSHISLLDKKLEGEKGLNSTELKQLSEELRPFFGEVIVR